MQTSRALLRSFLALFLLPALPGAAQYSILNVRFHGGAPYTDAELLTVSGFQPGQLLVHDSLAQGAQHLLDTGLFDDTEVTTAGQGKARTVVVELKPVPLTKLLPGNFENFVWWTPDELTAAIHARVPLYRGGFPEAGTTQDSVQTALQQMLAEKGVTATLSHIIIEPTTQHPIRVVDFRIDSPKIKLTSASIPDLPTAAATTLQPYFAKLSGSPYKEGRAGNTIEDDMLQPFRNSGYLYAALDNEQRTVAPAADGFGVTYTAHLRPGPKYTLADISCIDTPTYPAADSARDFAALRAKYNGTDLLTRAQAKVIDAFHKQGYIDVYIDPSPNPDDTAHTFSYAFKPIPGEQYHFHAVTALNLDPAAQQEFDSAWQMKPGDIYNESYVTKFLTSHTSLPHLSNYYGGFQASSDPNTHLTDVTITFYPNATAR